MTRRLLLFANSFPYGKQEPYLMRECHYLDAFDEVYIFSLSIRKHQREHRRDLPLEQVTKQLNKLVNVIKIVELEPASSVRRAHVIYKVKANAATRPQVAAAADALAELGITLVSHTVAIGGVEICPKYPINDPKAGLRIKAGCQTLDGAQALGYVRTRATPNADLDRVVHQREFMSALFKEATSPTTLLNPFEMWGLSNAVVEALSVDKDTHLWDLARLAWAMSGSTVTTTTPTAGSEYTSDGDSLAWGKNTDEFFGLLAADQPVPARLLSGTPGTG